MDWHKVSDWSKVSRWRLGRYLKRGGKHVSLSASLPKGSLPREFPEDVLVADLRYGGTTFIRGRHPRYEGQWTAYSNLTTGLARNVTFSHTITDETPIENEKSLPHQMQRAPVGSMVSEEYKHQHNHHQNLHSEVYNFSGDLNGVAIWGDSAALAPRAKSWGGFFSARSWPVQWSGYTPDHLFAYNPETEFDAAIIGIEVDVLNGGKNWSEPLNGEYFAKVGVQIVGFGKRNTAGIEIRTEDTDDHTRSPDERRGAWNWGIIIRNALHEGSTVLHAENGRAKRGIDFDLTTFSDGAVRIAGAGPSSGVMFDGGESGEVYAEAGAMNLRIGKQGLKIWNSEGTEVLLEVTDEGVRVRKLAPA